MDQKIPPLYQQYPKALDVPLLLVLSTICLIAGLYLPVITLKELVVFKSTFSVITGIIGLMDEGHHILAIVIFLFSVIFPVTKLSLLLCIWFFRMTEKQKADYLHWLGKLGKWSMLDVFIVAVTIVITKISKLASAVPRVGIYFFFISIILSIVATMRMDHFCSKEFKPKQPAID